MIRPTGIIRHSPARDLSDEPWQGPCVDDPEAFHVPNGQWEQPRYAAQLAYVRAMCAACPSLTQCAALLHLAGPESFQAGTTPRERAALRQKACNARRKTQAKETS